MTPEHASVGPTRSAISVAPLDRWLAVGGVIGPVLFVITFTLAGLARPGYSPVDQAISDLGIGENGWVLNLSLIVLGLLLVGYAIAFYRSVRTDGPAALRLAAMALISAVGLGYAAAGIFPETNPLHWLVGATLVYGGAIFWFLFAGLLLRGGPALRGWAASTPRGASSG
jgi:hypothetical membrane protein